jgi:hypothetical protein
MGWELRRQLRSPGRGSRGGSAIVWGGGSVEGVIRMVGREKVGW